MGEKSGSGSGAFGFRRLFINPVACARPRSRGAGLLSESTVGLEKPHGQCQCGFSCQPTRLAREEEREREEKREKKKRADKAGAVLVWILLALSLPTVHRIGEHRHRPPVGT